MNMQAHVTEYLVFQRYFQNSEERYNKHTRGFFKVPQPPIRQGTCVSKYLESQHSGGEVRRTTKSSACLGCLVSAYLKMSSKKSTGAVLGVRPSACLPCKGLASAVNKL